MACGRKATLAVVDFFGYKAKGGIDFDEVEFHIKEGRSGIAQCLPISYFRVAA